MKCNKCNGTGVIGEETCRVCGGSKVIFPHCYVYQEEDGTWKVDMRFGEHGQEYTNRGEDPNLIAVAQFAGLAFAEFCDELLPSVPLSSKQRKHVLHTIQEFMRSNCESTRHYRGELSDIEHRASFHALQLKHDAEHDEIFALHPELTAPDIEEMIQRHREERDALCAPGLKADLKRQGEVQEILARLQADDVRWTLIQHFAKQLNFV